MSDISNPAVDFDVADFCARFAAVYTGAISDVLDEMGYREQSLPSDIQGLSPEHRVAGVAMPVEGEPTESMDPEEIFIPNLRMLGDFTQGVHPVDAYRNYGRF